MQINHGQCRLAHSLISLRLSLLCPTTTLLSANWLTYYSPYNPTTWHWMRWKLADNDRKGIYVSDGYCIFIIWYFSQVQLMFLLCYPCWIVLLLYAYKLAKKSSLKVLHVQPPLFLLPPPACLITLVNWNFFIVQTKKLRMNEWKNNR